MSRAIGELEALVSTAAACSLRWIRLAASSGKIRNRTSGNGTSVAQPT
jgi:hypothetical protein